MCVMVYVLASMDTHTPALRCVHLCECVWRPQVDAGCLSSVDLYLCSLSLNLKLTELARMAGQ